MCGKGDVTDGPLAVRTVLAPPDPGRRGRKPGGARDRRGPPIHLCPRTGDLDDRPCRVADRPRSPVRVRGALGAGCRRAIYEPLIRYAGDRTDEFEGVLAESWTANDDRSVWTFTLREGIRFQDGSPCDAAAVKESFNRLFTLGLGPATELARFLTSADQIETPDDRTIVFTLDQPQPLFEQCVGSGYGAAICNAAIMRQHETEGDWGHAWAELNAEGAGTGPYRLTSFVPEDQVILERNDDYWRGWEDGQFVADHRPCRAGGGLPSPTARERGCGHRRHPYPGGDRGAARQSVAAHQLSTPRPGSGTSS